MFKMADTNWKKICSVLLSVTISGLGTPIICPRGSSTSVRDSKIKKNFIIFSLLISRQNNSVSKAHSQV